MSDLVEKLSWWLRYFNDETDKWKDAHPDYRHDPTGFDETAIEGDLRDAIEEIQRLRKFFEVVFQDQWDMLDPDGGDLQDTAEKLGLLVRVPADDEFKAEWGPGEMLVWAWNPLAHEKKENDQACEDNWEKPDTMEEWEAMYARDQNLIRRLRKALERIRDGDIEEQTSFYGAIVAYRTIATKALKGEEK